MSRRDEIAAEARALLETEGEEALTMRNLAARIGIQAPSLYKHVSGRREIETLLAAAALKEISETLGSQPDLPSMGRSYRAWALANPALYRVATTRPLDRENLPEGIEEKAAAPLLQALDGDPDLARAAWSLAHGLVMLELDGRFPDGADLDAAWSAGLSALG